MKTLYICEKPKQGADIAKVLGITKYGDGCVECGDITVTWCIGHLLEMASPEYYRRDIKPWSIEKLPVIPENWQMLINKKTRSQFNIVQKLLAKTKHVVIATDADREGEVIAREVLDYCKYQGKIERLWLSALDVESIRKALADIKPGEFSENLYYAGIGRRQADWLVGMNMTMAASSLFGGYGDGVLSVGRVQTPTLKIVVDRDVEIESFNPKNYYVLLAKFSSKKDEKFWAKWQIPEDKTDSEGRCLDQQIVSDVAAKIKNKAAKVEESEDERKKTTAPACLSLSELQSQASSKFGMSAKRTLDIAQLLYEKGIITYPRSDSGFLPESQLNDAAKILDNMKSIDSELSALISKCDYKQKSSVWKKWDNNSPSHHAIIPTESKSVDLRKLTKAEQQIYDLICRYYIAQFLGDYIYTSRTIVVVCENEIFKAVSNELVERGWKAILTFNDKVDIDKSGDKENGLPKLRKGIVLDNSNSKIEAKQTKPSVYFTEGTLIHAMKNVGKYVVDVDLKKVLKETSGIGTVATRDSVIETLIKRNYLERKNKKLISTKKGRSFIKLMPLVVKDPATTARWEQSLEEIAEGKRQLKLFSSQQHQVLSSMLSTLALQKVDVSAKPEGLSETKYLCSKCKKPLRRIKSKQSSGYFWGCTGFPECRVIHPDKKAKPDMTMKQSGAKK